MKTKCSLKCIASDGDHVTEGNDFPDTDAAWERSNDMGSRWYFYPIHVITSSGPAAIIRDVPQGMPREWVGKRLAKLLKAIAHESEHAADYCNGETAFYICP